MRSLSIFLFALVVVVMSATAEEKRLTFKKVDQLEKEMRAWTDKVGDEDLVRLSKIKQWPPELLVTKTLFPWLLPDHFVGRNLDLDCSSDFQNYRKERNPESYRSWTTCVRNLYRSELPEPLAKAVKDLAP